MSETPFNNLVPGYSKFEGGLSSDVEYYWTEDPETYPEDAADLATLTDDYGLTWVPYEGLGIHHRIWHFPRM